MPVDAAVACPEASLRLAYVAAFAMSNYSSTIGRIAKPFNPMLAETFEYCRLDKHFRYISEQVSCVLAHLDRTDFAATTRRSARASASRPAGATLARSTPKATSRAGALRSSVRRRGGPTRSDHLSDRHRPCRAVPARGRRAELPGGDPPDGRRREGSGRRTLRPLSLLVLRLTRSQSWRKVTTSVSGFITGSPTIDHFGDMVRRRSLVAR